MQQEDSAKEAQKKLSKIRKILEIHPFIPALKCLFNNHTNLGTWKNMLPPFYPLLSNQIDSLELELKESGMNFKQCLRKI